VEEKTEPTFELPLSRLQIREGFLYRLDTKGRKDIGRHDLSEIRRVEIASVIDWFAIGWVVMFAALAVFAKINIGTPVWSWLTCGILALMALIGLAGLTKKLLRLESGEGSSSYELEDPLDDCQAFMSAIRDQLK
jgi:hypothetical protein